MAAAHDFFPSRVLRLASLESLESLEAIIPVAADRINQHIQGQDPPTRGMTDEEITRLLNDPLASLVLRKGVFPRSLAELLEALDAQNTSATGVPEQSSFLIAEGGQIRFKAGLDKGGSRLLTVRVRNNAAELMISTLVPPGVDPRSPGLLNEVIAWDPINSTFHFYQRQEGMWFWCGQSDMALVAPTRGQGPFDSHVNGYIVMKELQTPWVHWHGPGLGISETAYAPNDPLLRDPLFINKDNALNFETRVVRPLADRWNEARFAKARTGKRIINLDQYFRQILDSSSANLISTHKEWSQITRDRDLDDIPPSFFVDTASLIEVAGIPADLPRLVMTRQRYRGLVTKHKLRVIGGSVNVAGDVPFCFTVPERALEDVLPLKILIDKGVLSARLAAALLMIDFSNPVTSPLRRALLKYVPAAAGFSAAASLDRTLVAAIKKAAPTTPSGSPEKLFVANWDLGPDAWRDAYADRIERYLAAVAARLASDEGADDIFRLAESRRREFAKRPLAEFKLSLPQATGISESAPPLAMTETATVLARAN